MRLQCVGDEILKIKSAIYGRTDTTTCPSSKASQMERTDCSLDVTDALKESCDDESKCQFRVNNKVFGTPCPKTTFYLTLEYECVKQCKFKSTLFFTLFTDCC